MSKTNITILTAAFLTSAIFLLIAAAGLDFIFLFLATIPLFATGLSNDPKLVLKAGALATIPIALISGNVYLAMIYFLIFVPPCWHICNMALHYYDLKLNSPNATISTLRLWYPMGLITVNLAAYSCAILALITAIFATQETNLPQQIYSSIEDGVSSLSKNYDIQVAVNNNIGFMVCGFIAWIWELLLLLHAWFVNRSLVKRKLAKRHSLLITPFPMPNWLLSLIGICALASLIGGESMRFLGKSCLIMLFLPYFLQGIALINIASIRWSNRRFLLFLIYFLCLLFLWPVFIIAGIGLWDHIKILNKHLSGSGTSSKS